MMKEDWEYMSPTAKSHLELPLARTPKVRFFDWLLFGAAAIALGVFLWLILVALP